MKTLFDKARVSVACVCECQGTQLIYSDNLIILMSIIPQAELIYCLIDCCPEMGNIWRFQQLYVHGQVY